MRAGKVGRFGIGRRSGRRIIGEVRGMRGILFGRLRRCGTPGTMARCVRGRRSSFGAARHIDNIADIGYKRMLTSGLNCACWSRSH